MSSKYIECGKIINTHGCRGGLKAEYWCNSAKDFMRLKRLFTNRNGEYIEYKVIKSSSLNQFIVFSLDKIDDMDKALTLKGKTVYALREDFELADGEFFLADLIGLDVIDHQNGKIYGKVKEIINRGASDIYVVDTPNGERMVPAVDEFIISVEIDKGVYVKVIDGLLD